MGSSAGLAARPITRLGSTQVNFGISEVRRDAQTARSAVRRSSDGHLDRCVMEWWLSTTSMFAPKRGDVLLRGSTESGFVVLDATNRKSLSAPLALREVIALARQHGAKTIWQQHLDERGRPIGEPFRVPTR
jgi:hypothetical protein